MKRGKLSTNLVFNILYFVINSLVTLWYTPFIIDNLGHDLYSYIPLVLSIVNYASIITTTFNSMIARFITVELNQGNTKKASKYFNSAFLFTLVFVVIVLPFMIFLSMHIDAFLSVTPEHYDQVMFLFLATSVNFLFTTVGVPFSSGTFCRNRFDIINIIDILTLIVRIVVVFVMFMFVDKSLASVSVSLVIAGLINLLLKFISYKALIFEFHFNIKDFDIRYIHKLFSSGIWNAINNLGTMMLYNIEIIIANVVLGAAISGDYAIANQLPNVIKQICTTIAIVFIPTITVLYAKEDKKKLYKYLSNSILIISIAVSIISGFLIAYGKEVLSLWIGEKYISLYPLMCLLTIQLIFSQMMQPLYALFTAMNKVRKPALFAVFCGILNVILCLLLSKKLGVFGIAISSFVMLMLKNFIFVPIYANKIVGISYKELYSKSLICVLVTTMIVIIRLILDMFFNTSNMTLLFLDITTNFTIICIFVYLVFIKRKKISLEY